MAATKIATCCYCGTRAALVLRGKDKHELSCANCGAPLRALKMLPSQGVKSDTVATHPKRQAKYKPSKKYHERDVDRPGKRRKSKSFGRRLFSEIWDVLEDVVDEVFD